MVGPMEAAEQVLEAFTPAAQDHGLRCLVVCVSVSHGNTAAVAHRVASVLHADVVDPAEVDPDAIGDYDLVGFGSGIFGMAMHPRLRTFLLELPAARRPHSFLFTTSGTGRMQRRFWQRPLADVLTEKGMPVIGTFACRGWDTWLPLRLVGGLNKGHPDERDLLDAEAFARRLLRTVRGQASSEAELV